MQAIQYNGYGPPDVLELVDIPIPVPQAGEVLIAVHAVSVGPGDAKMRAGELHGFHPALFPKIPGRSGAGRVVGLGANVVWATVGDAVCFSTRHDEPGCCAEFITRPFDQTAKIIAPLDILGAAAVAHPAACAWSALVETAQLKAGMKVLVHGGSGAVGAQAVQLAKHLGAAVTATASSRNAGYLRDLGADEIIAYDKEDFATRGPVFDVVFDLIGGDTHARSFNVLKPGGVLTYLQAAPVIETPPRDDVTRKLVRIAYTQEVMGQVLRLAANGALRSLPGRLFPLAACADAHRFMESGAREPGRVLLTTAAAGS